MENLIITFMPIILIISMIALVFMAIWVYKDAKKRGLNPWLWVLIVILLNQAFIGFIIYMIVARNEEKIRCENCGTKVSVSSKFCNNCGAAIKRVYDNISEKSSKKKNIIFATIVCIVAAVILSVVLTLIVIIPQKMFNNNTSVEFSGAVFQNIDAGPLSGDTGYDILFVGNGTDTTWQFKSYKSYGQKERTYYIKDPKTDKLYLNYTQDSGEGKMYIEQGEIMEEINLTNAENYDFGPMSIDLSKFKAGDISVYLVLDAKKVKFKLEYVTQ